MKTFGGSPLNMIAVAVSLLWKFSTPLRQAATHLFVLLPLGAYIVHSLNSSPLWQIAIGFHLIFRKTHNALLHKMKLYMILYLKEFLSGISKGNPV